MAGGSGDTFSAMLGVFVFRLINRLLVFAGLSTLLQGLYLGILMIIALLISTGTFAPLVSKIKAMILGKTATAAKGGGVRNE